MLKSKAQPIELNKVKALLFLLLLLLMLLVPALIHIAWITGPTVNAALFIATVLVGPMGAVLLGLMPSTVALTVGLLPVPLAPMIPFIIISNALLVTVFYYLYRRNYFLAVGVAAFVKFIFLHQAVTWLMIRFMDEGIVSQLAVMMSWPQFFTAVAGGVVAYAFLKPFNKV